MTALKSSSFSAILRWAMMLGVLVAPQVAQAQWHATVGAQSKDLGRQALAFLPNEIWIHAGDSITWKVDADEIHTVTFLTSGQVRPPFQVGCPGFALGPASFNGSTCVTTPPLDKGQTFTVTFPTAGNYKLVCLVHQSMTGVVHVLSLSQLLPHDQKFYDAQAAEEREDLLSDADHDGHHEHGDADGNEKEDSDDAHSHRNHVTAGTGEITSTAGGHNTLSVMRFKHGTTVIHAGETVEWTNSDPVTPHTITFGVEPANPMPPSANVTVDADGARHVLLNVPSDSAHSGFIVAEGHERIGVTQSPLGVTRFRATFTHAGTFPYICALHDGLGMKGKVIVLP